MLAPRLRHVRFRAVGGCPSDETGIRPVTLRQHDGTHRPKLLPMSEYTMFHKPRCTKSRETLALLEQNGVQPRIVEYLKTPPTAAELKAIVAKLGIKPEQLVRKGEEIYKSQYAGKSLDRRAMDRGDGHPSRAHRTPYRRERRPRHPRPPTREREDAAEEVASRDDSRVELKAVGCGSRTRVLTRGVGDSQGAHTARARARCRDGREGTA